MNVFILYYHPEPKSFNAALFRQARETLESEGHEVRVSDLHEMGFDPISGRANFTTVKDPDYLNLPLEESHAAKENGFADVIETEIQKMEWCDLMILQFPIWWQSVPAMTKGWIDRVFARRRTYGHSKFHEKGVFDGKKALVSTTTGIPEAGYQPAAVCGDILDILRPVQAGVLEFTGFGVLKPNVVYSPMSMDAEGRAAAIAQFADRLKNIASEETIIARKTS